VPTLGQHWGSNKFALAAAEKGGNRTGGHGYGRRAAFYARSRIRRLGRPASGTVFRDQLVERLGIEEPALLQRTGRERSRNCFVGHVNLPSPDIVVSPGGRSDPPVRDKPHPLTKLICRQCLTERPFTAAARRFRLAGTPKEKPRCKAGAKKIPGTRTASLLHPVVRKCRYKSRLRPSGFAALAQRPRCRSATSRLPSSSACWLAIPRDLEHRFPSQAGQQRQQRRRRQRHPRRRQRSDISAELCRRGR
jgi:hypothetical protein